MNHLLEVTNLQKIYKSSFSSISVEALKNVSFAADAGEFIAVMGESGSGKTTLLNLLAMLDKPTSGTIRIRGTDSASIKSRDLAQFRRNELGFVFQDFSLLDNFSCKDNILLPLVLSSTPYKEMESRLKPLARQLGIADILEKYPWEVSGGQKQRVAAARALIMQPSLLLADEPTGALDSRSSEDLLELFSQLNLEGQTIVMVTHSVKAASYASRVLFIRDGAIFHQIYKGNKSQRDFFTQISDSLSVMDSRPEQDYA